MSPHIEKVYSKIRPSLLLHIIVRKDAFFEANFRTDIVDSSKFLQLALLRLQQDQTFKPHRHFYKEFQTNNYISNECWIIMQGRVLATYYDIMADDIIYETTLNAMDISISIENGGHNYKSLQENTLVIEGKIGPYLGQKLDKTLI